MILTADYHTHTIYSHGKGKIIDNAITAKEKGLKAVGISDHGFSHPAFGLTKRKLPKMRIECDQASNKTGISVLLGIESNVIGIDGTVDLKPKHYDYFDIFLAGLHKFVMFKPGTFFKLSLPDMFSTYLKMKTISSSLIKTNTTTFINVVKNNPVDVITHLNYFCFADAVEVAKACADYGTYLELNSKKSHLTDEELFKIKETGVQFVVNSDAHSVDRIGDIKLVEELCERIGINQDRIANVNGKLPDFRFKRFKEGK